MCGTGMLPDAYEDALKCLLDDVPPRDTALIKSIIESEFSAPLGDVFETFGDAPIGAASIGQVHLATLKGSGQRVVVKVQYPEVEGFFRLDLLTIKTLCGYMMPDNKTDKMFDEVGKSFASEFDYRLEARNLRVCASNLANAGFGAKAFIPEPVDALHAACPAARAQGGKGEGLCTQRVMVMDAVQGKPVKKVMSQVFADLAAAEGKTVDALMDDMRAEFEDPVKLAKMLNTPPPSEAQVRVGLLILGARDYARNAAAACYNYSFGWFGAAAKEYRWTTTPPNGPALTRVLYQVHGHQVMEDGRFNADPHAGNVMICDDGRLGLIDYGNTPTLTKDERLDVARLIVALDDKDDAAIVRAFTRMGFSVSGGDGTDAAAKPFADKLMLFSAYGDFDQVSVCRVCVPCVCVPCVCAVCVCRVCVCVCVRVRVCDV